MPVKSIVLAFREGREEEMGKRFKMFH